MQTNEYYSNICQQLYPRKCVLTSGFEPATRVKNIIVICLLVYILKLNSAEHKTVLGPLVDKYVFLGISKLMIPSFLKSAMILYEITK